MLSKTTKNRFGYKLDRVFWWIVAFAPLFCYFLYVPFKNISGESVPLSQFLVDNFLNGIAFGSNPVWVAFYRIFSKNGVFSLFGNEGAMYIFFWFISVELVHLFFDVIVFIPRLAHKWISKAVQND